MYLNISKHTLIALRNIAPLHVFPPFSLPSFFIYPTFHSTGLHIHVGIEYTGNH